jgi:excisionase family DNA binding protein
MPIETPVPPAPPVAESSPWMTARDAAAYIRKNKKFVLREIRLGRLRAARVGGRGEILTRRDWIDEWVLSRAQPLEVVRRRR